MHRQWTALLVAVALAAACLSSPPASRAERGSFSTDQSRKFGPPVYNPYGDSDHYTNAAPHGARVPASQLNRGNGPGAGGVGRRSLAREQGLSGRTQLLNAPRLARTILEAYSVYFVEQ